MGCNYPSITCPYFCCVNLRHGWIISSQSFMCMELPNHASIKHSQHDSPNKSDGDYYKEFRHSFYQMSQIRPKQHNRPRNKMQNTTNILYIEIHQPSTWISSTRFVMNYVIFDVDFEISLEGRMSIPTHVKRAWTRCNRVCRPSGHYWDC